MSCLSISGAVNVHSGWGIHLHRMAQWMVWCDLYIRPVHYGGYGDIPGWMDAITSYEVPECHSELIIYTPSAAPTDGKRTCYFTMHETDRIPHTWVRRLNLAGMVLVPGKWVHDTFRKCGVKTAMRVVPLGCSNSTLHPINMDGPTVFGCAGRPQHGSGRKNVHMVLEAFQLAFPEDKNVRLYLKTFPDEQWKVPEDPRIQVTSGFLDEDAMTQWHAATTCFVSASRGEGWGLFQHHAMSVGRPVIGCLWGGVTEFMNVGNSYSCDYDLVSANYSGEGKWAQPRLEHLIDLMRYVHQSRDEAKRRGLVAHNDVKHLTWDHSCALAEKALRDHRFI